MTSKSEHPTKNAFEWTVFAISTLLVLGVAGTLALLAIRMKEGPAVLAVETGAPLVENGRVRVPVTVSNTGRSVATNVEITVSGRSGETVREAGFTVDFVPRGAKRRGSVSFYGSEVPEDLRAEVAGYGEP